MCLQEDKLSSTWILHGLVEENIAMICIQSSEMDNGWQYKSHKSFKQSRFEFDPFHFC